MSVCDKCTDGHPCEGCSKTQTFSDLKGRDALKELYMRMFVVKLNKEFIRVSTYARYAYGLNEEDTTLPFLNTSTCLQCNFPFCVRKRNMGSSRFVYFKNGF